MGSAQAGRLLPGRGRHNPSRTRARRIRIGRHRRLRPPHCQPYLRRAQPGQRGAARPAPCEQLRARPGAHPPDGGAPVGAVLPGRRRLRQYAHPTRSETEPPGQQQYRHEDALPQPEHLRAGGQGDVSRRTAKGAAVRHTWQEHQSPHETAISPGISQSIPAPSKLRRHLAIAPGISQ
eukprot:scaffold29453_cov96-Isochrysis_galbana.AAC.4